MGHEVTPKDSEALQQFKSVSVYTGGDLDLSQFNLSGFPVFSYRVLGESNDKGVLFPEFPLVFDNKISIHPMTLSFSEQGALMKNQSQIGFLFEENLRDLFSPHSLYELAITFPEENKITLDALLCNDVFHDLSLPPVSIQTGELDFLSALPDLTFGQVYQIVHKRFDTITPPTLQRYLSHFPKNGETFHLNDLLAFFRRHTDPRTTPFKIRDALQQYNNNPFPLSAPMQQTDGYASSVLYTLMTLVQSDLPILPTLQRKIMEISDLDAKNTLVSFDALYDHLTRDDSPTGSLFYEACTLLESTHPAELYAVRFTRQDYLAMGCSETELEKILPLASEGSEDYAFCKVYAAAERFSSFRNALEDHMEHTWGETLLEMSTAPLYKKGKDPSPDQICTPHYAKYFLGIDETTFQLEISERKILPLVAKGKIYFSLQNMIDLQNEYLRIPDDELQKEARTALFLLQNG